MEFKTEYGRIYTSQRKGKVFAMAKGIVGVELLKQYAAAHYKAHPPSQDPEIADKYQATIDESAAKISGLLESGGLVILILVLSETGKN